MLYVVGLNVYGHVLYEKRVALDAFMCMSPLNSALKRLAHCGTCFKTTQRIETSVRLREESSCEALTTPKPPPPTRVIALRARRAGGRHDKNTKKHPFFVLEIFADDAGLRAP